MKQIIFFLSIILSVNLYAQQTAYVGGVVVDENNQALPGVNIFLKNNIHKGVATDDKGYFELALLKGQYILVIDYLGYAQKEIDVDLQKNKFFTIQLLPRQTELNEMTITVKETTRKELKKMLGVTKLNFEQIKAIPMLLGEMDVLKAVQILPGVKAIGEGRAGFSVHGGSQDQNLILLDGAPVYHPSHILGFFSVFTPDIINDLKLYKSSIPARFGNRLSSILEVNTKVPNLQSFHFGGGIGMIASQLYTEGPIQKNKSGFLVSARKSYGEKWLPLTKIDEIKNVKAGFYDVNLKLNFNLSDKSSLKISAYNGRDHYQPYADFKMDYGNTVGSVYFTHQFNSKLTTTTAAIYSNYSYQISIKDNVDYTDYDFDMGLSIQSPNLKQDFMYQINAKNKLNFGVDAYYHSIKPGKIKNNLSVSSSITYPDRYAGELDFYAQHQHLFSKKFWISAGLRTSIFSQLGPGPVYKYNELGETIDTLQAGKNQPVKTYVKWAPHLAVNWQPAPKTNIKLGFDRTYQFLHYLINAAATTTPTDLWLPSSINLKPQQSDAFNLEFSQKLGKNYFLSLGGYYRDIQNITDYKIGTSLSLASNIESDLLQQKGKAYGFEFLLKKQAGKFTGSLAYTYSKSEKIHPDINEGKWYPSVVDRPHDVNLLLNYQISKRAQISAMWQYYTGRPITYPAGTYLIGGEHVILFFSHRNANRLPDYHRLDLSFTWYNKKYKMVNGKPVKKKWSSYWNFSIYNAYAHDNAFMIKFKYDEATETIDAYQVTLFKIVPAISYHFKF